MIAIAALGLRRRGRELAASADDAPASTERWVAERPENNGTACQPVLIGA